MHTLSLFILLLFSGFAPCIKAEEMSLPISAQSIISKTEGDIAKNRHAYEDANDKIFKVAEKALEKELDKFTKSGKLDEALSIKKTIETLRATTLLKIEKVSAGNESKSTNGNVPIFKMTTPNSSVEIVSVGVKPFNDHEGVFNTLPKEINGKFYGKSSIRGQAIEVTEDGYLFILTKEGKFSVIPEIEQLGFKAEKTLGITALNDALTVYGKSVKKGDVISFGMYGIVIQR